MRRTIRVRRPLRAAALGALLLLAAPAAAEQFVTFCDYHTRSYDDPIVFPGQQGASPHQHTFTGATGIDHLSTPASLLGTATTCDIDGDWSSYWHPSVYQNDVVLPAGGGAAMRGMRVYYRLRGKPLNQIRPFPLGLRMVVGNPAATSESEVAQALQAGVELTTPYSWSCSSLPYESSIGLTPPEFDSPTSTTDCVDLYGAAAYESDGTTPKPLRLRFIFPDCWDGQRLDSPDHQGHMAYSISGDCPSSHPVPLVGMTVATRYRLAGDFTGLSFDPSPGPSGHSLSLYGGHADFMNGWDPLLLERLVQECLVEDAPCATDPASRPALDPGSFPPGESHSQPTAFTPAPAAPLPMLSPLALCSLAAGTCLLGALALLRRRAGSAAARGKSDSQ